jgi:nuclear transport factor 2 (NTF2) superfamily protein
MNRPPLPPFTAEPAAQKARMAEDAWKTRDRARVALTYTPASRLRNYHALVLSLRRNVFVEGAVH